MRILTRYFLCLTLLLTVTVLSSGFPGTSQQSDKSFIVGDWILTNLNYPSDGRLITIDADFAGTYHTGDKQQKRIANVVYKGDILYFKVPELQLYFEMRKVNNYLDGKMTFYGTNDKRAPEPVRMTKKNR